MKDDIEQTMNKVYFKKEFDRITKELPEYTLGNILYGIASGAGAIKVGDLYNKTDQDILDSIFNFLELETGA